MIGVWLKFTVELNGFMMEWGKATFLYLFVNHIQNIIIIISLPRGYSKADFAPFLPLPHLEQQFFRIKNVGLRHDRSSLIISLPPNVFNF